MHTHDTREFLRSRLIQDVAVLAARGICSVAARPTTAQAQSDSKPDDKKEVDQAYIREHYTKYEYRIPMRDGVKLFTAVYVPKDASTAYPILLTRTPYSVQAVRRRSISRRRADSWPTTPRRSSSSCYQDVRGRFGSEGEFVHMRPHNPNKAGRSDIDESTDSYDTIDWLVKNVPNNNGKVGMMGISYPGLLHGGRHDRLASRAQVRLAAGAGQRLVRRRRLSPQRRVLPAARLPLAVVLRPDARGADPRAVQAVRLQDAGRLRVLSEDGPAGERGEDSTSKARSRSGTS